MTQCLHLALGGERADPPSTAFRHPDHIRFSGLLGLGTRTRAALMARAQRAVDTARMPRFIADLHRLTDHRIAVSPAWPPGR